MKTLSRLLALLLLSVTLKLSAASFDVKSYGATGRSPISSATWGSMALAQAR